MSASAKVVQGHPSAETLDWLEQSHAISVFRPRFRQRGQEVFMRGYRPEKEGKKES